ncbi:hypothetical protein [Mycolicibacterium hodleri]|nr:hypothetical protein [Mycolicibacterium hodleri]
MPLVAESWHRQKHFPASRLRAVTHVPADVDPVSMYAGYRKAMPAVAVMCRAEELTTAEVARWVRRHGVTVTARSSSELALAVSAGIRSARLVMHGDGGQWAPIRWAVNASVRQFVVDSCEQIPVLEHYARRRQQVLVDVDTPDLGAAIAAVCASDRLDLVGLHCPLDRSPIHAAIAEMARIRRDAGVVTGRLIVAGALGSAPEALAAVIEDAVADACAEWSFPRPALALTPR